MPKQKLWKDPQCLFCPKCKKIVVCYEKGRGHGGGAPEFRCKPKKHKLLAWSFLRDSDIDLEIAAKKKEAERLRCKLLMRIKRRRKGVKPNSRTAGWELNRTPGQLRIREKYIRDNGKWVTPYEG